MAIWFYRLLFFPVMLVLAPYYLWRMRRRGGYAAGFGQRFGAVPPELAGSPAGAGKRIWLQAVSVGELLAIGPLVESLLADEAGFEIYLTTTTSTGYALARERYGDRVLAVGYFPLDFWPFSARAWNRIRPDLAILTEGERWPEHIHQAAKRNVPVVAINARLSDRSYRRMRWMRPLVPGLMGGITRLLTVGDEDARRFAELGFAASTIEVTGNLKVDVELPELSESDKSALRAELGFAGDDPIVLGSSTWPGEEKALLEAWRQAREVAIKQGRRLRLLLVPRHAERRNELKSWLTEIGQPFHLRSLGPAAADQDVVVADTTGELQRLTQLAAVVFVGKSLPPHREGQTPVEAAGLGRPLMLGPGMANFRAIARDLRESGAAVTVDGPEALAQVTGEILGSSEKQERMAVAGRAWHQRNRGALNRTVIALKNEIDR